MEHMFIATLKDPLFGEQTYILKGKQARGLKDISTNLEQVAVWIESFGVCSHISTAVDDMCVADRGTAPSPAKHKKDGGMRRDLDKQDRQMILNELQKHFNPLTDKLHSLYNIYNGQVAFTDDVNIHVQDAVKIGQEMHTAFLSLLPDGSHNPIKKKVKTVHDLKKSVKVNGKPVYDMQVVFPAC